MAGDKLQRLSASLGAIVDKAGVPVREFTRFWDAFATRIERNEAATASQVTGLAALVAQLQATQTQLATVETVANSASATATQANGAANPSEPQRQSASGGLLVTSSSWTTALTVTFGPTPSAVSASSVDLDASGPTGGVATYNPHVSVTTHFGEAQMLRNGSVIAGPVSYDVDSDGNFSFAGFSAPGADSSTGTVTYDLQVRKVSGATARISLLNDVTRTP